MILDHLTNFVLYEKLHPDFKEAFAWLNGIDPVAISPGRYSISGDEVYAMVSEYLTKPAAECRPESHRAFTDIQLMVRGKELMGWEPLNIQEESVPYDKEADITFYKCNPSVFELSEGCFSVFFPSDIHMPCMESGSVEMVKKIVIKVKSV
ncbi:MAG: YhcH/YjgK/YiaL family protein [Bacteroidales bacterium]|nr:YhcH/YjgK/YiaL family protein [Bacteroidales bacterium]